MAANEVLFGIKRLGLKISAKSWNQGNNFKALALHGWLDNANSFDLVAQNLGEVHTLAVDLPGHGHSDHLAKSSNYTVLACVEQVILLIEENDWSDLILIGHSLGACIASLVVSSIPDRIKKIVLIEGVGPFPLKKELVEQFCHYIKFSRRQAYKTSPVYASIEEAAKIRCQRSNVDYPSALLLAKRGTKKTPYGYIWRADPRLLFPPSYSLTEEQTLGFLAKISCPSLYIQGREGFFVDSDFMKERLAVVKDITTKTLPGGHHLHLEYPEVVAQTIKEFL